MAVMITDEEYRARMEASAEVAGEEYRARMKAFAETAGASMTQMAEGLKELTVILQRTTVSWRPLSEASAAKPGGPEPA